MSIVLFSLIALLWAEEEQPEPYFFEPFEDDSIGTRWIPSEDPYYNGTWVIEDRLVDFLEEGRKGLTMTTPKTFNGISCKSMFTADASEFVVQYEVKIQEQPVECGGAYLKIINQDYEPRSFNDSTTFAIMFGPDRCGSKNKVQFIERIQNPKSGHWAEHSLAHAPQALWDNYTHLYRLVLTADQRFEISIDGKVEISGDMNEEGMFEPPFEPPKTVADYSVKKPDDWVDEAEIVDVNDTKPEDWDEDAPMEIRDPNASKPDDWNEDEPLYIPDPNATQPADWNEEEDGKYEIPMIENPACESHGCGKWEAPLIPNPNYKGKWSPRMIPNPDYKGPWAPPQIPNKNHFIPQNLHVFGQLYGVGIDVLALTPHVLFDNIYIGRSLIQAMEIANDTWVPRHEAEMLDKKLNEQKQRKLMRAQQWSQFKAEPTLGGKAAIFKDLVLDLFADNWAIGVFICGGILCLIIFCCTFLCRACSRVVKTEVNPEGEQSSSPSEESTETSTEEKKEESPSETSTEESKAEEKSTPEQPIKDEKKDKEEEEPAQPRKRQSQSPAPKKGGKKPRRDQ